MFEATRPISTRPRPDAMRPRPRPDTTRPRPNNLASRPHRPQHPCVTVCHLTLVRLSNAIVLWGRWLMQALRGAQPSQIFDCWSNRLFCQCLRVFIDANNVGKTLNFCLGAPQHFFINITGHKCHSTDTLAETQATANPLQAAIVYAH